jgi:hypothetical protein
VECLEPFEKRDEIPEAKSTLATLKLLLARSKGDWLQWDLKRMEKLLEVRHLGEIGLVHERFPRLDRIRVLNRGEGCALNLGAPALALLR